MKKLLLVEDGPLLADAIVVLVGERFGVTQVADGEEARVRLAAGEDFDVVLSDIVMPRMDGLRLILWVRAACPDLATRFVFMTSDLELHAAHILSTSYIVLRKPFTLNELLHAIQLTLEANRFVPRSAPPRETSAAGALLGTGRRSCS